MRIFEPLISTIPHMTMDRTDSTGQTRLVRTDYYSLMVKRIRRILMISSSYDAYILEEDGQIEAQLYREYIELNISNPPVFTWVNTTQEAMELLEKDPEYDLIVDMFNIRDAAIFYHSFNLFFHDTGILLTNFLIHFNYFIVFHAVHPHLYFFLKIPVDYL